MLLKLAFVLEKNFDYFLLDTPYAKCDSIIDNEIAAKLKKCNVTTLITVGKLIDVLIDQQEMIKKGELVNSMYIRKADFLKEDLHAYDNDISCGDI